MEQLYIVGFLVGVLTVFFDVAYQSFLPSLVRREHLLEGNSQLEASGPAALLGALLAGRAARRFGLGPTIVGSTLVPAFGALLIPLAGSSPAAAVPLLVAGQALFA